MADFTCMICGGQLMASDAEDFGDIMFGPEGKSSKFSDTHYVMPPLVCGKCTAVYFRTSSAGKGANKMTPTIECPVCKKGDLHLVERQNFASIVVLDRDGIATDIGNLFADDALWCPNCKWIQIAESGADDSFVKR